MHKDDRMTPNERMQAFMTGGHLDRLPAMPLFITNSGKIAGMTHREKRSTAANQAKAQIDTYRLLGNDTLIIEYGLQGVGMSCGSIMNDPEDDIQSVVDFLMKDINDVDKLDPEMIKKEKSAWLKLNPEATEISLEAVGQEVPVNGVISGPATACSSLFEIDNLLRAQRKNPEKAHQLYRFVTDALKYVCDEFLKLGAGVFIADPIASGSLMSERDYRKFVLPYTKELFDHIHSQGAGLGYHICGNARPIVDAMGEAGANMFSIDDYVPIEEAKEKVGDKTCLFGYVKVNETMLFGTPKDIYEEVKENIRGGWDNKCGYILSTGCDVPLHTPMENNIAFMVAARELGKWPIDPERFI